MKNVKIKINSIFGKLLFEYECQGNNLSKTLEDAVIKKVDLRGADLQGADLQGADLQRAYLQGADLRGPDLRGAYLRGTDLQGADLRDTDLRGAYLQRADLRGADLRGTGIYQVVGLGSEGRCTSYDSINDKIICGCWYGSLQEFIERVDKVYPSGNKWGDQYRLAIELFKSLKNKSAD